MRITKLINLYVLDASNDSCLNTYVNVGFLNRMKSASVIGLLTVCLCVRLKFFLGIFCATMPPLSIFKL